ncbi:MAG: hypothetical protein JOY70_03345 [Acidisphaera sp.]|nr:hypothetical protein [Acidisphaera sp.]MBV9814011.1 hypothetical protein [Acetobacteraceae bacterium]
MDADHSADQLNGQVLSGIRGGGAGGPAPVGGAMPNAGTGGPINAGTNSSPK